MRAQKFLFTCITVREHGIDSVRLIWIQLSIYRDFYRLKFPSILPILFRGVNIISGGFSDLRMQEFDAICVKSQALKRWSYCMQCVSFLSYETLRVPSVSRLSFRHRLILFSVSKNSMAFQRFQAKRRSTVVSFPWISDCRGESVTRRLVWLIYLASK